MLTVEGFDVAMTLVDTRGDGDKLRVLSYAGSDVVIICFNPCHPDGVQYVESKWLKEVRYHLPYVPILLLATKTDLKNDAATLERLRSRHLSPISSEAGLELSIKIGAFHYLECSSKYDDGVLEVFNTVSRLVLEDRHILHSKSHKSSKCSIS